MIDYHSQQEERLVQSLYRALSRADYWTKQVAKAQNKKQVELWGKIRSEAYGHIENCIYLLEWNKEKRPKNIESDLPIIVKEPLVTRALVPSKMHRSFGGILLPDEETRE